MRSARMLLATAAATAVLGITAPGAFADGEKWEKEDNGYSKEDNGYGKEHDKDSSHDRPHGGVHTGGGALTSLNNEAEWESGGSAKQETGPSAQGGHAKEEDAGGYAKESWKDEHDPESMKDENGKESWKGDHDKESWKDEHGKGSWKGDHDKPHGGVHTGGGALATPAVTAGGMAVIAVAGTGLYAARRRKSAGSMA